MRYFEKKKQEMFIIQQLAHKDKSRENASAFLGQFWQVLNPFINMITLIMVFSTIFGNKDFVNYPMYIATGTIIFELFSFGTKNCINALVSNKKFLIRTQMSKEIYVKERVYVALTNFGYSFLIYLLLMVFYKIPFRVTNILILPDLLLLTMFVYGFGKILSVISVVFADVEYFYDIFKLFVYYGSAVFYNPEKLSIEVQFVLSLNPIYLAIAIARQALIDGICSHYTMWIKLAMYSFFFFWMGEKVFEKGTENIVAKL